MLEQVVLVGLSPHAWGNQDLVLRDEIHEGSIPTRVGEPETAPVVGAPTEVYPHTRGGTLTANVTGDFRQGLSPHAWGNPE